jgi:hypothetical protein
MRLVGRRVQPRPAAEGDRQSPHPRRPDRNQTSIFLLNGNGFHIFPATKVNSTGGTDVFAFSVPLKMMLHPNATFFFSSVAGVSVSGYLVKFTGP